MRKLPVIYTLLHRTSSVFMMLALVWLTISTPLVNKARQVQKENIQKEQGRQDADDNSNPLAGTTEEKTETGVNTLSEYLHDATLLPDQHAVTLTSFYKCYPSDIYFAYHPELLSPPPELSL